jgi:hypothetical protein
MEPTVHLQLDIVSSRGTLTGQVGVQGAPPQPFTGWIALNAAIDNLVVLAAKEGEAGC